MRFRVSKVTFCVKDPKVVLTQSVGQWGYRGCQIQISLSFLSLFVSFVSFLSYLFFLSFILFVFLPFCLLLSLLVLSAYFFSLLLSTSKRCLVLLSFKIVCLFWLYCIFHFFISFISFHFLFQNVVSILLLNQQCFTDVCTCVQTAKVESNDSNKNNSILYFWM